MLSFFAGGRMFLFLMKHSSWDRSKTWIQSLSGAPPVSSSSWWSLPSCLGVGWGQYPILIYSILWLYNLASLDPLPAAWPQGRYYAKHLHKPTSKIFHDGCWMGLEIFWKTFLFLFQCEHNFSCLSQSHYRKHSFLYSTFHQNRISNTFIFSFKNHLIMKL